MAGQNRRLRRRNQPLTVEPSYSLRTLVKLVGGFLVLIGLLVISSFSSFSKGLRERKTMFESPQEIPLSIIENLDAILILGGGVPESIDHPPAYVERRCDDAVSIVQKRRKSRRRNDIPILCLSAGTAHLPQLLGADGLPIWESTASAAYLSKRHGLSKNVYVETTSYDTIGNAFFARTSHTDINGWKNLLIITNEFHMSRTQVIFDWIFSIKPASYKLYFLSSPNVGLTSQAVLARKKREAQSERTVREKLAPNYTTLKDVWKFLNNEHSLYTASKLIDRGNGTAGVAASDMVKLSYGKNNANVRT